MRIKTRSITITAILAAIAAVLMYLEFIVPPFPNFLKFDFSDLPAYIASLMFSPLAGVAVETVKNLLHLPYTQTGGIGELANFIMGSALVFTAGTVYHKRKSAKSMAAGMTAGTLGMSALGGLLNYFMLIPFYVSVMKFPLDAIIGECAKVFPFINSLSAAVLFVFVPFNILKGALISAAAYFVHKRIVNARVH